MSERRKRPFLGQNAPEDDFYAQFYGPKDNSGDRPIRDEEPKKKAFWAGREVREPKTSRESRAAKEPRLAKEPKPAKEPRPAREPRAAKIGPLPRTHRAATVPLERERGPFVAWVIARRTALGMAAGAAVAVAAGLVIVSGATGAGSGGPTPHSSTSGVPFDLDGIAGQAPTNGPVATVANGRGGSTGSAGTGGAAGGAATAPTAGSGGGAGSTPTAAAAGPGHTSQPAATQPTGSATVGGPGPVSSTTQSTSNPPPSSPTTTAPPPSSPHPTCVLSALGQCVTLPSLP